MVGFFDVQSSRELQDYKQFYYAAIRSVERGEHDDLTSFSLHRVFNIDVTKCIVTVSMC